MASLARNLDDWESRNSTRAGFRTTCFRAISGRSNPSGAAFLEHIAEESALLNRVAQCNVLVRQIIEPPLWHVPLGAFPVVRLEHRHRE